MSWYIAQIVFRVICGDGIHCPQFDEQQRLISAVHEEEAFEKAQAIGSREADSFFNQNKLLVQWQYVAVASLTRLGDLKDGAELCSRIHEVDDADAYLSFVADKSNNIRLRLAGNYN